ncbi:MULTISPECIES: hypothetical protein [Burkholderia cepacia complex]|uniref:hypothetical protein n=1 Tax=Burkholderia cepacia complex TaxID=87882 RepID=UPI001395F563|nr:MULTISPECIES: hypothetical protein [Burkholderia cepacia complex]
MTVNSNERMSMITGSRCAPRLLRSAQRHAMQESRGRPPGFTGLHLACKSGRSRVNPARFFDTPFCHYAPFPIHTINQPIFGTGAGAILKGYKTGEPHSCGSFPMIDTLLHAELAYRTSKERNSTQRSCCADSFRITSYHPENKIME